MSKKKQNKIIITCAVTGGIHTPTMSDALPYTPDDIATNVGLDGEYILTASLTY